MNAAGRRILLVTGEYPPMEGGVADFTAILARHMAMQGAEVGVLTSTNGRPRNHRWATLFPWIRTWNTWNLWQALRAIERAFGPEIINIQYQTAAFGMHPSINWMPRLTRVPCVATFHDLKVPYLFPKAGSLRQWVNRELARTCQAIIVTNMEDWAATEEWPGIRRKAFIPIGSNVSPEYPPGYDRALWRSQYGLSERALVLGYFGFLNASKGGENLIASLAALVRAGYDAYLLMIGGTVGASDATNIAYLARIREAIIGYGLFSRVIWTGYLSNQGVSAAFGIVDICVLPYQDGVSFRRGSLMAALAHGLPIVSTYPRVPIPELVHGENIYLVPPGEVNPLAEAIIRLADNPALCARLRQGAQALARRFQWEDIAQRTLQLYDKILSEQISR